MFHGSRLLYCTEVVQLCKVGVAMVPWLFWLGSANSFFYEWHEVIWINCGSAYGLILYDPGLCSALVQCWCIFV